MIAMKIKTIKLLPRNTRVKLKEGMRKRIFSDKKLIVKKLKISLTQIHNWKNGVNNPTIDQLEALGIDLNEIWKSIESFNLERGICKVRLPQEINLQDCMWLIGINEGDSVNRNRVIGITNQNETLIKCFITEITRFGITKSDLRLVIKVNDLKDVDVVKISEKFEIPMDRIEIRNIGLKTNEPIFQVFTPSRLLHRMFNRTKDLMKTKINHTRLNKFVQGFFDAEGCVTNGSVKITQKDVNSGKSRMDFIRVVLNSLNIRHSFLIDGKNVITIRLCGGKKNLKNLKRFRELIGFSHPEKDMRLKELINNFENCNFPEPKTKKFVREKYLQIS